MLRNFETVSNRRVAYSLVLILDTFIDQICAHNPSSTISFQALTDFKFFIFFETLALSPSPSPPNPQAAATPSAQRTLRVIMWPRPSSSLVLRLFRRHRLAPRMLLQRFNYRTRIAPETSPTPMPDYDASTECTWMDSNKPARFLTVIHLTLSSRCIANTIAVVYPPSSSPLHG
jgi:hypothetical protein